MKTLLAFCTVALFSLPAHSALPKPAQQWMVRDHSGSGQAVTLDSAGDVFVGTTSKVQKYWQADGSVLWEIASPAQIRAVVVDANDDVIVAGASTNATDVNAYDFYTAKYSGATGALVWAKTYNGPAKSTDKATSVAVDASGNVYATGYTTNAAGNLDYYTVSYAAADGTFRWEKIFDGPGHSSDPFYDRGDFPCGIVVDHGGNVTVSGTSTRPRPNTGGIETDDGLYTVQYNGATGAILWEKRVDEYHAQLDNFGASAIVLDSADNVIVVGTRSYTVYAIKYSAGGGVVWEKADLGMKDNQDGFGFAVAVDGNDDVLVTGAISEPSNVSNFDGYTVKYDGGSGALVWRNHFDGKRGGPFDESLAVGLDAAGNVIVAGWLDGPNSTKVLYTAGYQAADGKLLWDKIYDGPTHGDDRVVMGRSLATAPDGSIYVVGSSIPKTLSANNFFLLKFGLPYKKAPRPGLDLLAATGYPAPGAGGASGLPADALVATLNAPATDDEGDTAFLAKWTSKTGGRGTGLFLNASCLGIVGGNLTAITGAKYKSFTDPVVAGGSVACIATLTGVPKPPASVVLSNASGSATPAVVARAGDIAPDLDGALPTGGAVFGSFKEVALNGGSVAFLAQLTGGTGAEKVTTGTDMGVWIKESGGLLRLAVREGDSRSGKTIKTLVSFATGNGSPGQGRGWLTVRGSGLALALAQFTDKSWGVINARPGASGAVSIVAQTGTIGAADSPAHAGASFAGLGIPAENSAGTVTFLGSMTVGLGDVTKANARGIFRSAAGSSTGPFSLVFREDEVLSLKDPVLAEDGGLAFPATLRFARPVPTLWWQPPGGGLSTVASAGQQAGPDLPAEARWKTFQSLAIANHRGPIFAATLAAGKGGVTAANATGVWATNLSNSPRLLFRTGVPNAYFYGKSLRTFTLLKAAVGSTGVTRSFNGNAAVVWLAAFNDGTQAIIRTAVP